MAPALSHYELFRWSSSQITPRCRDRHKCVPLLPGVNVTGLSRGGHTVCLTVFSSASYIARTPGVDVLLLPDRLSNSNRYLSPALRVTANQSSSPARLIVPLTEPPTATVPVDAGKRIESWSLTSLQQRLVKTGGRLVKHARHYWLCLAESHLTRRLFGALLQRIWALPVPAD